MTNKTETTKREMFHRLAKAKKAVARIAGPQYRLAGLENAIESHLEALRQEIEGLRSDVRSAEKESERLHEINRIAGDELRAFQQAARTDREDTVRAVAQADALADQLSEAHRTIASQGSKIQAQQLAIGDLYMRAIF